jgi:HEAT repeat protein
MPITMRDVRKWLDAEEVEYTKAKRLGAAAIPFLMELVQGGDLGLASKATYLASLIDSEQSVAVLETAVSSNEPILRSAAASGIRNLPEAQAERILDQLKDDPDAGIRKVMLNSLDRFRSKQIEAKLQQIAQEDPEPFLRELASSTIEMMRRRK